MNKHLNFSKEFDKFIKLSISGRRLTVSGKRICKGTISQYNCVKKLIKEFELTSNQSIRIAIVNRASLRDLQRERKYWEKFYQDFSAFLYREKKCYDNYVLGVFRVIKTFFQFLSKEKAIPIGEFHKRFRVPTEYFTPAILMPKQLQFLILDQEFESRLSSSLKRTKDIFVFGCTVGLRYHDLMNLKKANLQVYQNEYNIILVTQKTGAEIRVNLPNYAAKIIEKYRKKSSKYLLPRLSCTNFNLQIKSLIRNAGWDYYLPKIRHRYGKAMEIKTSNGDSWKFYQHITAHTMRRTAISTLLMMGLNENIVRRISGHAPGSKEFHKYVVLSDDYLNQNLKLAYQKLLG